MTKDKVAYISEQNQWWAHKNAVVDACEKYYEHENIPTPIDGDIIAQLRKGKDWHDKDSTNYTAR